MRYEWKTKSLSTARAVDTFLRESKKIKWIIFFLSSFAHSSRLVIYFHSKSEQKTIHFIVIRQTKNVIEKQKNFDY